MGNVKRWGSYDTKAAAAEQEMLDKLSSGEFMKLRVGRNVVRVLPPLEGEDSPFIKTFQHFIEMPGMTKKVSFNCPRRMANRPCPACSKADELRRTGNPADYDLAGSFLPRFRVYVRVIDRGDEDAGPKVLAIGKSIHEDLVSLRANPDAGGDYTHPEDGFDIVITRKGTGRDDTKYTVNAARDESPLGDDEQVDAWLDIMPDTARLALVPNGKDIRKMLLGAGADEDDIGALPAQGQDVTRSSRARKSKRTAEDDLDSMVD